MLALLSCFKGLACGGVQSRNAALSHEVFSLYAIFRVSGVIDIERGGYERLVCSAGIASQRYFQFREK